MVDKDLKKKIRLINFQTNNPLSFFLKHRSPWWTTSVLWKKRFFLSLEGFNESYQRFQDTELHCRAIITAIRFETFYDLEPDNLFRVNHQTRFIEREPFLLIESYLKFYCDFYNLLPMSHREKVVEMDPLFVFFFKEKCLYQPRSFTQAKKIVSSLRQIGSFSIFGKYFYFSFILMVKGGIDKMPLLKNWLNKIYFNRFAKQFAYGLGLKKQTFY
jgi:hypothetical protein